MNQLPAVVLLPRHPTSMSELLPIARHLLAAGVVRPVVVLANQYATAHKSALEAEGLTTINMHAAIEARLAETAGMTHRLLAAIEKRASLSGRLGNWLPIALLRMRDLRRRLMIERRLFHDMLRMVQAKLVLLPGDRELSPVPSMLAACRDEQIPSLIAATNLPYTGGLEVTRLTDMGHRAGLYPLGSLLTLLAAGRFPKQALRSPYGRLLFSPGWRTFALAAEGMLPDQPWIQGGGWSDYILQHNYSKLAEYKRQGLADRKIVLIGDVTLDPLHHNLLHKADIRESIYRRFGDMPDVRTKPIVVMAVPNEAEHNLCDWPTHLARQENFWSKLAQHDAIVLLSLHPKSDRKNYQALADRCGFHFADERLHDILPAADLFVCSCSTTCLWAKLCAVPVVNMDYLGLRLDYFREAYGVIEVYTPEGFAAALPTALGYTRSPEYPFLQAQAQRIARDTIFDGQAMLRLAAFISRLVRGERPVGPILPQTGITEAGNTPALQQKAS